MSVILVFAVLLLFSCGNDNQGNSNNSNSTSSTEALYYNGIDVSKPVDLVFYYLGDAPADEDRVLEEINKRLKEKINATLELKTISLSDYATKYALTIAGGKNIDLMYTSTWCFYQSEANKGAFVEITDQILNDYMPLHKEMQSPASFKQAEIAGKAYFVPNNMANVSGNAILIRGDLREKYGIGPLKDVSDLEKYYEAVVQDTSSEVTFPYNASQNLDQLRYVMYFGGNDFVRIEGALANYFTYPYSEHVSADDIFWIYDSPEYVAFAKQMKEWNTKGFWSKSSIANATDVKDAFTNGLSASYSQNLGTLGAVGSQVNATHPDWKPEIYDITPGANRFLLAYTGDGVAVLESSKNKERAFMALDLLKFDKELHDLVRHGIEGVHYEIVDGQWQAGPEFDKYKYGSGLSWGLKNSLYYMDRADMFADESAIGDIWKEKAQNAPTATFAFDDTNVKNELANLQSVYTQYVPLLDLGLVDDVDETLKKFKKQAELAGLDKITAEVKKQAQEHFNTMGIQ